MERRGTRRGFLEFLATWTLGQNHFHSSCDKGNNSFSKWKNISSLQRQRRYCSLSAESSPKLPHESTVDSCGGDWRAAQTYRCIQTKMTRLHRTTPMKRYHKNDDHDYIQSRTTISHSEDFHSSSIAMLTNIAKTTSTDLLHSEATVLYQTLLLQLKHQHLLHRIATRLVLSVS